MPSCNDIPDNLVPPGQFDRFVQWLHANVPNRADRKALGKCWAGFNNLTLTRSMWDQILNPPEVIDVL